MIDRAADDRTREDLVDRTRRALSEHLSVLDAAGESLARSVAVVATIAFEVVRSGGSILTAGNGGSAADAQHFTAELVGRFRHDRPPIRALTVGAEVPTATAVANDLGFDRVFERQIEAFAVRGDLVIGLTTSGTSPNVVAALRAARLRGCTTVCLTGSGADELDDISDLVVRIPSSSTARVQEGHAFWLHSLADLIDQLVIAADPAVDRGATTPSGDLSPEPPTS